MSDKKRGLYQKYNVTRTDGKPVSPCIVLEAHDVYSRKAITHYADLIKHDYPQLSNDLIELLKTTPIRRPLGDWNE